MPAPGQRAQLLTVIDHTRADAIRPTHSIELLLAKSPKKGVKCGGITGFRANSQPDFDVNPDNFSPELFNEMQKKVGEETQVVYHGPEKFRETEGRWLPWACDRMLQLFDEVHGDAHFVIVCPALQIYERISKRTIVNGRGDPRKLFARAWEIDRLLSRGYSFDPWSNAIRRGRIGADVKR